MNIAKILELPFKGNFIPYPSRSLVEVGQPAPDFTLPDTQGRPLTLSAIEPRWCLLYLTRIVDRGFI
ncbi:MAG: hypothetical protein CFK52_08770 [Chloracidobacterium sp. CP2_5A]|nr:MAG: hypothetical protein CFK52_08770 [Chloracidobacterium sp. CP2_5A]